MLYSFYFLGFASYLQFTYIYFVILKSCLNNFVLSLDYVHVNVISQVIAESMSEEEIGGLKELFKMIDTDNSGTITFDELKDGLKRMGR